MVSGVLCGMDVTDSPRRYPQAYDLVAHSCEAVDADVRTLRVLVPRLAYGGLCGGRGPARVCGGTGSTTASQHVDILPVVGPRSPRRTSSP